MWKACVSNDEVKVCWGYRRSDCINPRVSLPIIIRHSTTSAHKHMLHCGSSRRTSYDSSKNLLNFGGHGFLMPANPSDSNASNRPKTLSLAVFFQNFFELKMADPLSASTPHPTGRRHSLACKFLPELFRTQNGWSFICDCHTPDWKMWLCSWRYLLPNSSEFELVMCFLCGTSVCGPYIFNRTTSRSA